MSNNSLDSEGPESQTENLLQKLENKEKRSDTIEIPSTRSTEAVLIPEDNQDPSILSKPFPPLWKTYKSYVLLIVFPIIFSSVFLIVDKTQVLCPVPCWTVRDSDPYSIKECDKAWAYHKNECHARCMPCEEDDDECIYKWMDPKTRKDGGPKSNPQTYWNNERDSGCWVADEVLSPNATEKVLDGMDYAYPDRKIIFDEIFNYKKGACAFCVLVMSGYWISECLPLAVTAFLPVILYPIFSIVASKELVVFYFCDIIALFFGGLAVASAIEYTHLHRRIALRTLLIFGGEPKFLLLGFMAITSFLAMWISNIATAAMVFPTAIAVMDELRSNLDQEVENEAKRRGKNQRMLRRNRSDSDSDSGVMASIEMIGQDDQDYEKESKERYRALAMLNTAMCIGIGYSSSIGGMGMFTGTAVNMIFAGLLKA